MRRFIFISLVFALALSASAFLFGWVGRGEAGIPACDLPPNYVASMVPSGEDSGPLYAYDQLHIAGVMLATDGHAWAVYGPMNDDPDWSYIIRLDGEEDICIIRNPSARE